MKLEDLQKAFKVKELRRLSCEALDRGDEDLAVVYHRAAKALNYWNPMTLFIGLTILTVFGVLFRLEDMDMNDRWHIKNCHRGIQNHHRMPYDYKVNHTTPKTMTPQETREAFMTEFQEMLRRYNAEFDIVDVGRCYFPEYVPEICFNGIYDGDGNVIREPSEFQMPSHISWPH